MRRRFGLLLPALTLLVALAACRSAPTPGGPDAVDAPTHEEYADALADFGLDEVALGRDWLAAAARALEQPIAVTLPFTETGHLSAQRAAAVAYRFDVRRGRRLAIDVTFDADPAGTLFVDLFEVRDGGAPRRVAGLAPGQTTLEYDVRRDAAHVLRLQPELLRGGRYSVTQRTLASVAPPVGDFRPATVRSGFGAPRDGGARSHHGVDIFRPRGTPVIAAADGYAHLDDTPRGGRVVWLRDARTRRRLYYAHLDDWAVESGAFVRTGDVLGYVGNTGNAVTTPPHLHFGVYDRGPADPVPYLAPDDPVPPPIAGAARAALGRWMRVTARAAALVAPEAAPARAAAAATTELPRGTLVWAVAALGGRFRVELPDGTLGVVRARDVGEASAPLGVSTALGDVRESPAAAAPVIETLEDGVEVRVFGRFGGFSFVELPDARRGWIAARSAAY